MGKTEENMNERRTYPRVKKLYLVSYIGKEEGRQTTPVSMGRTLDISQAGVNLEIFQPIDPGAEMELEIGIKELTLGAMGTVTRYKKTGDGQYALGIRFNNPLTELPEDL
ncbi:MAG: hypothetical protein GY859_07030 [Desulfobacterales bacterium]|nr:hypothetical protein [Desulfobacterales bacterium]